MAKIAVVLDEIWDSALTHYGHCLLEALSLKHHCALFCLPGSYIDRDSRHTERYHIGPLRGVRALDKARSFFRFARTLGAFKPDIVVTIRGDATFFACLLKGSLKFSLVRVFGEDRQLKSPPGCLDGIILPCAKLRDRIRRGFAGKLGVIHGCVDTDRFRYLPEGRRRIRRMLDVDDNIRLFGAVGRLDPVKGYHLLIESFCRATVNSKLVIVGKSKGVSAISLLSQAPCRERIKIVDERRDDISEFMSAFDVGVISSVESEIIPRVALEFLACGLPIVSTDVGCLSEVLKGVATVVKPTVEELASALSRYELVDLEPMKQVSADTAARFSWEEFSSRIVDFFNSLL